MLFRFSSQDERTDFLKRLHLEAPALEEQVQASYSQPTVVTVTVDDRHAQQRLLSIARQDTAVKIFGDVTFSTMGVR
ncbi:hypothetical protein KHC28_04800 [Ancylobacter sonchi]|uniref:hypothetical protein n=1 Tax=Ancylobacter sonchi TaxID=1937790 RepID=UPI001BD2CE5D|nr:hypothetical protein [Ancylobacter sonchi]MBS7532974.1 hypothetical protein [Ancylobacter sonchi]